MAYRATIGLLTLTTLLAATGAALLDDPKAAEGDAPKAEAPKGDETARARGKDDAKAIPEAEDGGRVVKSESEWRRQLTPLQFYITRAKGTEPAWSGKYSRGRHHGTFLCVGCGAELFHSDHKFESGTGWPSFWRPIVPARVSTAPDFSAGEPRVEVECTRCGAHLGHVFYDGPPPTGLRFCLNSAALKLKPPTRARSARETAKARARAKARAEAKPGEGEEAETEGEAPAADDKPGR